MTGPPPTTPTKKSQRDVNAEFVFIFVILPKIKRVSKKKRMLALPGCRSQKRGRSISKADSRKDCCVFGKFLEEPDILWLIVDC